MPVHVQMDNLDREAVAMLYVAGELEPAEREAFERRLADEPQLAAEVEQLRAAQQSIAAELQRADAHTRLPTSEGVVVRRVSRAIGSWLVSRSSVVAPPVKKGLPLPWWSYPTAAAAVLLIGFLVWSSRQEVPPMSPLRETTEQLTMLDAEQAALAEWLTGSLTTADASMDQEMDRILSRGGWDELNAVYFPPRQEENAQ